MNKHQLLQTLGLTSLFYDKKWEESIGLCMETGGEVNSNMVTLIIQECELNGILSCLSDGQRSGGENKYDFEERMK